MAKAKFILDHSVPWNRGKNEQDNHWRWFQFYLSKHGQITDAAIACEFDVSIHTVQRVRYTNKWRWRCDRWTDALKEQERTYVLPPEDFEPGKTITDHVPTAQELAEMCLSETKDVTETTFQDLTRYYRRLTKMADTALPKFDESSITSITDLKNLMSLISQVSEARQEAAETIYGIEELTNTVRDIKKQQRKGRK